MKTVHFRDLKATTSDDHKLYIVRDSNVNFYVGQASDPIHRILNQHYADIIVRIK